jgi:hypothetical protein
MTLSAGGGSSRVVTKETKEQKALRLKNLKDQKKFKTNRKVLRKKDEKKHYIELCNRFHIMGVDYAKYGKDSYAKLVEIWDGKVLDPLSLSDDSWKFLKENFVFSFVKDDYGRTHIRFKNDEFDRGITPTGKIIKNLIKESGQPYSAVSEVYSALVSLCKKSLVKHRKFVLPELGRFSVKYKRTIGNQYEDVFVAACNPCAKDGDLWLYKDVEKIRKCEVCGEIKSCRGIQKRVSLPEIPAKNRLRLSPSKSLRTWTAETLKVAPPVKRSKEDKKKRRHRKKKYRSAFDDQKEFHIT